VAIVGGMIVYGVVNKLSSLRLSQEDEFIGADLAIHKIGSTNSDK
jgi:Amt family ammonium transporter